MMESKLSWVISILPFIGVVMGVGLVLTLMHRFLIRNHPELNVEERLPRQLWMLAATLAGLLLVVLSLPVGESSRNQVIALIGVLASGVLAFSSTTFMTNFVAGLMLRLNRPFKTGDFVRVDQYFGRVSARGLLDTEIQSEQREFIAIPNSVLVTRPVTVISGSGAIISANVSLGYDVHHGIVEAQLLIAAEETGLTDPFVQVTELGNYSVSYRISGLLTDVKSLITTRSNLHRAVLDKLHGAAIEIVSPTFMNQRQVSEQGKVLAHGAAIKSTQASGSPEDIIFDKAEAAEQVETAVEQGQEEIQALQTQLKEADGGIKKAIEAKIEAKIQQQTVLTKTTEKAPKG